MQDFEGRAKRELLWRVVTSFGRKTLIISRVGKDSVSPIKIPVHPSFEILHLAVRTSGRMNVENR